MARRVQTITDDRGAQAAVLTGASRPESMSEDDWRRYRARLRQRVGVSFVVPLLTGACALLFVVKLFEWVTEGGDYAWHRHVGRATYLTVCIAAPIWLSRRVYVDAQSKAASLSAMGWCGLCAHSLEGLTREADGCVVCAECGSAWKGVVATREATP